MADSERVNMLPEFLRRVPVSGVCGRHGSWETEVIQAAASNARCPLCLSAELLAEEQREREAKAAQAARRRRRALERAGISERFLDASFDQFVAETPERARALARFRDLAAAIATHGPKRLSSLIVSGPVGTGKTLLCSALVIACEDSGRNARRMNISDLIRDIRASWGRDADVSESEVLAAFGGLDLLVVDEIGVQGWSDNERHLMFEVVNRRYEACLPTVFATNLDVAALSEAVGERVMDRLREDGGKFLALTGESWRRRA